MGQLEFPLPYWDNVSEAAKVSILLVTCELIQALSVVNPPSCLPLQDLIRSMLEVEVDQRYTALQVLEHPWVTVSTVNS